MNIKHIKYRLAKPRDCKAIVELHYSIRETYSVGIFAQLNRFFLKQYYLIILNDPNSVIVCAEDENGIIQGFCSSTLDVEAQFANIKRHRIRLGLAAITSVIEKPLLLKHLIARYMVIKNNTQTRIISTKGARSEYWVWRASNKDSGSSVEMYFSLFIILKALGVKELFGEVDKVNKRVLKFQLANGGRITDEFTLPDGRERVVIRYDLENWKPKGL